MPSHTLLKVLFAYAALRLLRQNSLRKYMPKFGQPMLLLQHLLNFAENPLFLDALQRVPSMNHSFQRRNLGLSI
ncbi:hypothetical protein AMQ83_17730 [Paenibacillus riograndensis]|nr:hypothetical protein AMQ83_17730 [Paenibacillus riograndensis]